MWWFDEDDGEGVAGAGVGPDDEPPPPPPLFGEGVGATVVSPLLPLFGTGVATPDIVVPTEVEFVGSKSFVNVLLL